MKDPRFAPDPEIAEADCHGGFLPIEIEGAVAVPLIEDAREMASAQHVDITLSDGRRILVEGPAALSGVLALVEGLIG